MAKACHLPRPYLAWIPVANAYLIGQMAECGASRGGKKCMAYRKILLGLQLAVVGIAVVMIFLVIIVAVMAAVSESTASSAMFVILLVMAYLALMGVSIAYTVFCYIAYWQIFRLFDENNAVIYLVVSILFSVASPFIFLILSRKTPALDPVPEQPVNDEPNYLNL